MARTQERLGDLAIEYIQTKGYSVTGVTVTKYQSVSHNISHISNGIHVYDWSHYVDNI